MDVPKINVKLPIKHGTEDDVLENCIGHIERTSFPIGGENTHTVLSGHRALATAKLFTDIDKLETGDIFYITVGNRKLAYEVDSIQTVLPSEVNALKIQEGKDLATLVTCTPYGINTHRLLVTGHRVDLTDAPKKNHADPMRDVIKPALIVSGIVIVMTFACIITIVLIWKKGRRNE